MGISVKNWWYNTSKYKSDWHLFPCKKDNFSKRTNWLSVTIELYLWRQSERLTAFASSCFTPDKLYSLSGCSSYSISNKEISDQCKKCLVEIWRISTLFCRGFNSFLLSRKRISIVPLSKKHFSVKAHKYWVQLWMKFVYLAGSPLITVFSLRYQLAWFCTHVQESCGRQKSFTWSCMPGVSISLFLKITHLYWLWNVELLAQFKYVFNGLLF